MLEYAYQLKSFHFLEGLIESKCLEDFYQQLAHLLAQKILNRGRKGFYRAYLPKTSQLNYVRGCVDLQQAILKPFDIKLSCHYQEHTADVEENQILAWTLLGIARSGLCTERVLPKIRQAYRTLQGAVTLKPINPENCIGRIYNRLNQDYQPLHALCRFFLENSGPSHEKGDRTTLPFLVNMAHLYELFIAQWLKAHLPSDLYLKSHETISIGKTLHFQTDLVLYDVSTGTARYILDTKYKTPASPSTDDVAQAIAYAVSKHCRTAILVYPVALSQPLNELIGDIHIRSLTFCLEKNLDIAGKVFLQNLLFLP